VIALPADAVLEQLQVDSVDQPLRQAAGDGARQVTIPLRPGAQQVEVRFREPRGIGGRFRSPSVGLDVPAVNVTVTSARAAGPSTAPVSASTPEGTSTATTNADDAVIARRRSAYGSRATPWKPKPNTASMMDAAEASAARHGSDAGSHDTPAAIAPAAARPASALSSAGATAVITRHSRPDSVRR
jgi:hypothetical protein